MRLAGESAGESACPTTGRSFAMHWWDRLQPVNARLRARFFSPLKGMVVASPDAQIVDAFQRCAAGPADDGVAIAAHQGVGDRPGAGRAVEFGCFHATWRRRWNRL